MKGQNLYNTLLLLYPKPFRTHFGSEMLRLYQDCYPGTSSAGLWIEIVKDLATSIPREWHREICWRNSSIDYTGARFARGLGVPEAGLLFAFVTIATAALVGVLAKCAAARSGVVDPKCSLHISYERTTVRFSR